MDENNLVETTRDEDLEAAIQRILENHGHENVKVKYEKHGEGGPGPTDRAESAGTWTASSSRGTVTFWLTWHEYNTVNDEILRAAIARGTGN